VVIREIKRRINKEYFQTYSLIRINNTYINSLLWVLGIKLCGRARNSRESIAKAVERLERRKYG